MSKENKYWSNYNRLQKAKHDLLKTYLGGWYPILSKFSGRIIYVDSHAGRGRHFSGEEGSPLIALKTLLNHTLRDRIINKCEVVFLFLELRKENVENLNKEINNLGTLPKKIKVEIITEDYVSALNRIFNDLEEKGTELAPSFFFIDPFGFLLPIDLMRRILDEPKSELLITFMVRYIDMAVHHKAQENNLDLTFGNEDWRELRNISDPSKRYKKMLDIYAESLGASYCSILEMKGKRKEPKYSLVHITKHAKGRELMKDSMWNVTPDGTFQICQNENPNQLVLISNEPNLTPLENELIKCFKGKSVYYNYICGWLLPLPWRKTHINKVIAKFRKNGEIIASEYKGKFAFSKNPLITFKKNG